ncbi:guanylate kinase [Thermodesulfobacteriota bacterium]
MTIGNLFIISAPSGTGKTTILKKVIAELEGVGFSVSHTTRQPRPGEAAGKDYFFVKPVVFEAMQAQNAFLEYAEVHGNLYGSSKAVVENLVKEGKDVILDIDVQGARQIREKHAREAVFIFIVPPSLEELEKRLKSRETDSQSVIKTRLQNARQELADMDQYDYIIVNDEVENAVEVLRAIIIAERSRKRRSATGAPLHLQSG